VFEVQLNGSHIAAVKAELNRSSRTSNEKSIMVDGI
jgi:hypothetical protein